MPMKSGCFKRNLRVLAISALAMLMLASCGGGKRVYHYPNPTELKGKAKIKKIRETLVQVLDRNRTVEDSPEWIASSYESIHAKPLLEIAPTEYAGYEEYARGNRVFIIVHPAFYTFFTEDARINLGGGDGKNTENVVERLMDKSSFLDPTLRLMQQQERMLLEFMEAISTEKILMIVIVPGNYRNHLRRDSYGPFDEYARFLNEMTNGSASVVYVQSRAVDDGKLLAADMQKLIDFIYAAGVRRVYMGGGYVGRCLEGFYEDFTDSLFRRDLDGRIEVYMVPEISAVSPVDMNNTWGRALILPTGEVDYGAATKNLKQYGAYGVLRIVPKTRRFYIYGFKLD